MPSTHIGRFWSWQREPAPAATAVERVYETLSAQIVDGTIPGGEFITEGEIALRQNVSRTPVREAFLVLESQGLLKLFPKKGALVTSINPTETAQLLKARIMLESSAATSTAADPALANDLQQLIDQQLEAAESGDIPRFARADHRFHARVVAASGNPIVDDFYAQLGPQLARLTCHTVANNHAQLQQFIDEHRQLAALLASNKPHAYQDLLTQHVNSK